MLGLPRPAWARDVLLGGAVATVAEVELLLLDRDQIDGAAVGHHMLILLIAPAVGLRRVSPLGSIAVASLGFAVQPLMGSAPIATPYLALLFLLGSLGWYASLRSGALGVGIVLVSGVGGDAVANGFRWADLVVNVVIIVAAWAAAHAIRQTTDRRIEAEVAADRRERAAADAERTRIAQDLHDSLAHALTLITLQAGGARERAGQPEIADTLEAIECSGREALADMHRFLGLLGRRSEEAPGIADLGELAEAVRRGGLEVTLVLEAEAVPTSVSTTVYRVVQEGLTNVMRHSDARKAVVSVQVRDGALVTEIHDDGQPIASRTGDGGHGLDGLRRRIGLFDGSVSAGPTDAGWRLEAWIPLQPAAR